MPGKIVTIAKLKGGCGATTLTRELSAAAIAHGLKVAVADLDAQGSLTNWWNRRTAADPTGMPPLVQLSPDKLITALPDLRHKTDLLFIDTPPSTHDTLAKIAAASDLAVIPAKPTADDLDAVGPVIRQLRGSVPLAFVISQITGKRSPDAIEASELLSAKAPVIGRTTVRVGYYRAANVGSTGHETDSTVRDEIEVIFKNLADLIDLKSIVP